MRVEQLLLDPNIAAPGFRIKDDYGAWSREDLCQRVHDLAINLRVTGLDTQDRVALICENGASFLVGVLGIMAAGGIVVPLDPQLPFLAAMELIRRSDARFLCLSGVRAGQAFGEHVESLNGEGIRVFREESGAWTSSSSGTTKYSEPFREDGRTPALILFTSGTSGAPKGVVLSHQAVLANVEAIYAYMKPTSFDLFFITKTMVHSSTLVGEVLTALRAGAGIIALNPVVSPSAILTRLMTHQPTIMCVNPTILWLLNQARREKEEAPPVRLIYTSGSVAGKDLLMAASQKFPKSKILNVYGLTEVGPRVTAQRFEDKAIKPGSVGRPIDGVTLRIVDQSGNGRICEPGETGILQVKSPSMMEGYWNDPENTKRKIRDGWLDTGDLGYLDEDGDLYILGRADEMIIRGAHNVDPNRIEGVLREIPGVRRCVVFGTADPVHSQKIVCALVMEPENQITIRDVLAHCGKMLAPYECPQEVCFWEQIPLTPGGKVSRRLANEFYQQYISLSKKDNGR